MSSEAGHIPLEGMQPVRQVTAKAGLQAMASDPRTTNALLLIMVLCISGYMPDGFASLCGV